MTIIKGNATIINPNAVKLVGDAIRFLYGEQANYCFSFPTDAEARDAYEEIIQAIKEECAWIDLDIVLKNRKHM